MNNSFPYFNGSELFHQYPSGLRLIFASCFKVACWKVRFNASALFSVVFPLVDVTLPTGEYEAEVERCVGGQEAIEKHAVSWLFTSKRSEV